jgi:hypothetical protein
MPLLRILFWLEILSHSTGSPDDEGNPTSKGGSDQEYARHSHHTDSLPKIEKQ